MSDCTSCGHEGYVHFLHCGNSFTVYMTPKPQLMEGTSLQKRLSKSIITLNLGLWGPQLVSLFPTSTPKSLYLGGWTSGPPESLVQGNQSLHVSLPTYNRNPQPPCTSTEDLVLTKKMFRAKTCAVPSCLTTRTQQITLVVIIIALTIIIVVQLFH